MRWPFCFGCYPPETKCAGTSTAAIRPKRGNSYTLNFGGCTPASLGLLHGARAAEGRRSKPRAHFVLLKAVVCTCVCVCACVCMRTHVVRGRGGHRVCLWSSESGSTLCPGLQGGKSQFSLVGCTELGRPRVAAAALLTIATWAPCGHIFWFQGPWQLDFAVKRWHF